METSNTSTSKSRPVRVNLGFLIEPEWDARFRHVGAGNRSVGLRWLLSQPKVLEIIEAEERAMSSRGR